MMRLATIRVCRIQISPRATVRLTKINSALCSHAQTFNTHDHTFKVSDLNY